MPFLPTGANTHDLGDVYASGRTMAEILADVTISYTLDGTAGSFAGLVTVIPEPSSCLVALIGSLVLGATYRRRQCR